MAAGDVLCQSIRARGAGRDARIDWRQTARFGTVGLTLHGPYFLHAFRWLDSRFGAAATLKTVRMRSAHGQEPWQEPWQGRAAQGTRRGMAWHGARHTGHAMSHGMCCLMSGSQAMA